MLDWWRIIGAIRCSPSWCGGGVENKRGNCRVVVRVVDFAEPDAQMSMTLERRSAVEKEGKDIPNNLGLKSCGADKTGIK